MIRVEQGTRQHRHAVAQARGGFWIAGVFHGFGVQRLEDTLQAGILTAQQGFDAAVFKKLHGHALERTPVIGDQRPCPAPVAHHMGEGGAIAIETDNPFFTLAGIVIDIRYPHAQLVVIRHRFTQFVKGRGVGHQLFRGLPQATQVEVKLALDIHEQRAVTLALQHGAAVSRLHRKVVPLPLRVRPVVANTVFHPVIQTVQR